MATKKNQRVSEIPSLIFNTDTIDVNIRIRSSGQRYEMEIQAVGRSLRAPVGISPNDLAAINQQIQDTLQSWDSDQPAQSNQNEQKKYSTQLAEIGNYAFRKVFSDPYALSVIQELGTIGQRLSIQIVSEDFFLPWEILYPVSIIQQPSYDYFWGLNHIISRVLVQDDHPGAFVSPAIPVESKPRIGLLSNTRLPAVLKHEVPFFENLAAAKQIQLFKLRALDANRRQRELKAFRVFWKGSFDVVHFACHANYEQTLPQKSFISLSDDFSITLVDLEIRDLLLSEYPLVILNACETGNLNPQYTSHFVAFFMKHGARGIVATECAIPDEFAAEFVEKLYNYLLAGKPLGESLVKARRFFLDKYHNPLGLLYSMYASPLIRLTHVGGKNG